ncbi:PKD domain-containing protein [Pedobacter psychroterrae]|uniref:PKD domain-containing protein n=1 Tax=Pedobacter psychroterrae TaxID=2530453 RepID=A0A4V2ML52_9SPHI|nr:PKD domain-containing protein [Pedobacter psychroterrae]TCD00507.1 PKD domain-containing protein [Pedobacter psychroterrae]
MKKNIVLMYSLLAAVLVIGACKKGEDEGSGTKAVFSYVADGYKVNFTNFSTNSTEFMWDFGDGSNETSTKKSPQHIFKSKGNFLVSLTTKNGDLTSQFIDTVSIVGPNIKIDGDFTDWEYVGYTFTNEAGKGGNLQAIKTFASSTAINFYLEGTADMKMEILDLYLDADNNTATGFSTWQYPAGSGAEFLFEGSFVGGWGDMYAHSGPPAGFNFTPISSFAEELSYSTIKTVSGKKVIEFSIKRNKLGALKNFVNFSITELTSGWADVGSLPVSQTPTSTYGKIPL